MTAAPAARRERQAGSMQCCVQGWIKSVAQGFEFVTWLLRSHGTFEAYSRYLGSLNIGALASFNTVTEEAGEGG